MRTILFTMCLAASTVACGTNGPTDCSTLASSACSQTAGCQIAETDCTACGGQSKTGCEGTTEPSQRGGPACSSLAVVDCEHREDCTLVATTTELEIPGTPSGCK